MTFSQLEDIAFLESTLLGTTIPASYKRNANLIMQIHHVAETINLFMSTLGLKCK